MRRLRFIRFARLSALWLFGLNLSLAAEAAPPPLKDLKVRYPTSRFKMPAAKIDVKKLPVLKRNLLAAPKVEPKPKAFLEEPYPEESRFELAQANTQGAPKDIASLAGHPGTGDSGKCTPLSPRARVTFNFKGTLEELARAMSKTTCRNFILDNNSRRHKVEILSPTPVTMAEAWRAFLASLSSSNYSILRSGRYYKIINANEGTRSPVQMYKNGAMPPLDDRIVTAIWQLKHTKDINRVVNYLNIFKSKHGQIHAFAATNTLIITDESASIHRVREILDEIDVPGAVEQVSIIQIDYANATDIAQKLTQVFEPGKPAQTARKVNIRTKKPVNTSAKKSSSDDSMVVSKIIADERTNKLIVIASKAAVEQIRALSQQLDVPEEGDGTIHVLQLKHADAEKLSSTLSSLAQGSKARRVVRGKAPPKGPDQLFQGEVKITADKATNSLVITASKADLASMKRVIEKLDVPRYQVFVEAVILEVSVNNDRTLGTGWHAGVSPEVDGNKIPIIFGSTPNAELSSLRGLGLASLLGLAGAARGPTLSGTESIITGGIPAMGVVLHALQSTNDVNVISTPHLLTMDNEQAEIKVNEKRPFPSGLSLGNIASSLGGASSAATSALGNLSGLGLGSVSFNREDVGLTLKLKPQINDSDHVRLEIDQQLSDVAGVDQVTNQVITSNRAAKTTVVVRSQDSVVIGGLVRERETIDESKMPLLGDLPLLGWLFKRQKRVKEKVNLLLVITPYIIRTPDDFRRIYERKMAERKEFVDRFYGATAEYRASIDWDRKSGPLARYHQEITHQMSRPENDGPGDGDETVIRADEPIGSHYLIDGEASGAAPGGPAEAPIPGEPIPGLDIKPVPVPPPAGPQPGEAVNPGEPSDPAGD